MDRFLHTHIRLMMIISKTLSVYERAVCIGMHSPELQQIEVDHESQFESLRNGSGHEYSYAIEIESFCFSRCV